MHLDLSCSPGVPPDDKMTLHLPQQPSQPIYWYHAAATTPDQVYSPRKLSNPVSLLQYLRRAQTLSSLFQVQALYTEWARTYDGDMCTIKYAAPRAAIQALVQHAPSPSQGQNVLRIMDAGCGTGIIGDHLARVRGWENRYILEGIDLVQDMLSMAKAKNTYDSLKTTDLHEGMKKLRPDAYAAILLVGVLQGSVIQTSVLNLIVLALRRDGLLILTIEESSCSKRQFELALVELQNAKRVETISRQRLPLYDGHHDSAVLLVIKKR